MPWPVLPLARLAGTGTAIALLVALAPVPGAVVGALPTVDRPLVALAVAAVVTFGGFVAWRRMTWPKRPSAMLHSVPEPSQPYQRDTQARLTVDRGGFLFGRRVLFIGAGLPWRSLRGVPRDYDMRFVRPIAVHTVGGRTWWAVGNEFYWASSAYHADTVEAVVDSLRWRRRARLDTGYADAQTASEVRRERILAELRPNLSKHNGLVCIRCRGVIDLREEPVAPVWTDGGVRLADLQLLCSRCSVAARGRRARAVLTRESAHLGR